MTFFQKMTSTLALAALAASPAMAQPTLVGNFDGETASGNNIFVFQIISDNLEGSYAIELGFEATINNSLAFGGALPTNSFSQASTAAEIDANFDITEDTYFFDDVFPTANPGNNPFTGTVTNGFIQTPTTLFLSYGSGINQGSPVNVVRIVTPDDAITFSGVVAQAGVNNLVSGVAVVPEPTTAALLGLGGMALLARKRREA